MVGYTKNGNVGLLPKVGGVFTLGGWGTHMVGYVSR